MPYLPPEEDFKAKGFSPADIEIAKKQYYFALDYSNLINPDLVDDDHTAEDKLLLKNNPRHYYSDIHSD